MPWTIKDVDSHKKGLTEKQKRQWVRVANSVYLRCKKDGGKECEAVAIRQANGVVGTNENYTVYAIKQDDAYDVRIKIHQKRKHIIVPVTMMVEGVHHGSAGKLFHPISELGKVPAAWNGIPVVIYHPQINGNNISANSPDVIDRECVGRVYNTYVDGDKLKAEVWLDEENLKRVDEDTLISINEKKIIEVSVGVFTEDEEIEGEWNGEQYDAIATNHKPDHLALLPGETGACSIEDGCGVRVNSKSKKEGGNDVPEIQEMIQALAITGYSIAKIGDHAKQGYRELMDSMYTALRGLQKTEKDNESYCYLIEMYDSYIVYEESSREGSKLYKQNYTYKDGAVEFTDNPVPVKKEVKFVEITNNVTPIVRTKFNTNKEGGSKMPDNQKCTDCVKKKVNDLIANSNGKYTEADREELETYSEAMLDKISQPIEKVVEKVKEVGVLTAEQQADLAFAQKIRKEKKDALIKGIKDNTAPDTFTDAELEAMSDTVLEKLNKSVSVHKTEAPVDYSGMGHVGSYAAGAGDEEPLYPLGVEIKK